MGAMVRKGVSFGKGESVNCRTFPNLARVGKTGRMENEAFLPWE